MLISRVAWLPGAVVFLLGVAVVVVDKLRPEVLLVGNVTIDVVNGNRTLGGAVSYAAAVAEQYGKSACVVTAAGPDADLSIFERHRLKLVEDEATLTFQHSYTWWGHHRVLHVPSMPNVTLGLHHVPLWCMLSRIVLLGPLLPSDLDGHAFARMLGFVRIFFKQDIGLMAQGFQRDRDRSKKVVPLKAPHQKLLDGLGAGVSVFLSDVETDPWPKADLNRVVNGSDRLVVTRGEHGADEYTREGVRTIPAAKVDSVEDTNGAGDTFATAFMFAVANGSLNPGKEAALAASRTVKKPQACKPWCVAQAKQAKDPIDLVTSNESTTCAR
ncbi:hypothetical protein BSKO_08505 [Bryopsis sp. KO-2023]|nr:hypothetical protein BSKO_08505 [Bryopsis sp. KO-2023]